MTEAAMVFVRWRAVYAIDTWFALSTCSFLTSGASKCRALTIERSNKPLPGFGEFSAALLIAMYGFPGGIVLVHVTQLIGTIANHSAIFGVEFLHPFDLTPSDAGNPVGNAAQGGVRRAWEAGERVQLDRIDGGRC